MILLCAIFFIVGLVNASPLKYEENDRFFRVVDDNNQLHYVDLLENEIPITRFDPEEDIRYILYTQENPLEFQVIKKGENESLLASNFDINKPLKVTIAGWNSDHLSLSNTLPRDAFLAVDDVNVITVDWTVGSQASYTQAVQNTLTAGPSVAEFLDWINDVGVPFSQMHLVGNSLGGQMVGIIGRNTRGEVEHITSMDPANPFWGSNSERIRKTDGKYVELIHTNVGVMGMRDAAGHNDFYPNQGLNMPGCDDFVCSHELARHYFAESVVSGGFTSVECLTVAEALAGVGNCTGSRILNLGGTNIKEEIGIFALETNAQSPFSKY